MATNALYFATQSKTSQFLWLCIPLVALTVGIWWFFPSPWVPLLLGVMWLFALFSFLQPHWLCLAYFYIAYFNLASLDGMGFLKKIMFLLAPALGALLLMHLIIRPKQQSLQTPLLWFALFILFTIISSLFAENPIPLMTLLQPMQALFMVCLAVFFIQNESHFDIAARLFIVIGVVFSILIAISTLAHGNVIDSARATLGNSGETILNDPNYMAQTLLLPTSFALSGFLFPTAWSKINRLIAWIALPILMFGIVIGQSRGGFLALAVILLLFFTARFRFRPWMWGLFLLLCAGLFYGAGLDERAVTLNGDVEPSSAGRLTAWYESVQAAFHSFWGLGLDQFSSSNGLISHSMWFEVIATTGFLGFALFLAAIISIVKNLWLTLKQSSSDTVLWREKLKKPIFNRSYCLLVSWLSFCLSASFLNNAYSMQFAIIFGLLLAITRLLQNSNELASLQTQTTMIAAIESQKSQKGAPHVSS